MHYRIIRNIYTNDPFVPIGHRKLSKITHNLLRGLSVLNHRDLGKIHTKFEKLYLKVNMTESGVIKLSGHINCRNQYIIEMI